MGLFDWWRSDRRARPQPAETKAQARQCASLTEDQSFDNKNRTRADNPIQRAEDDVLGRLVAAQSFARQVLELDASEGAVVGVVGLWGSGKTSFVNLARRDFERAGAPILDFNPWMFSGASQLVESFFIELSAALKLRPGLADVGKGLEEYGEAFSGLVWLPLVGPWLERGRGAASILGKLLQRRKEGVSGRRARLHQALARLDKPIIVALDDIDRLTTSEIRDLFKLVRLTASFPNVIYILAFDRMRVEEALSEQGIPGRDYLEKILQVVIDLPAIPQQVLASQILTALDTAISDIPNPGPFDETTWADPFAEVVRPLVRSMRDVRRYALAVRGTLAGLDGNVALADVLVLEAIRVFLPDVFVLLPESVEGLTTTSEGTGQWKEPPRLKEQIDRLLGVAGQREPMVRAAITGLFPAAKRHMPGGSFYGYEWKAKWLSTRRVAHEDILRFYLERTVGEGLQTFLESEKAWPLLSDRQGLDRYLRSLDRDRLQDVIAALENYEEQFSTPQVVPATIVLLNLLPDLPERKRQMFGLGTRLAVTRVTYRLLRSLKEPAEVEAAVRNVLPELTSLTSRFELITTVGHREGAGHRLVAKEFSEELEKRWRAEVRSSSGLALAEESDLLRILLIAGREADSTEGRPSIDASPEFTLALLRSSRTETMSQTVGSRAVRRQAVLAWDALIEVLGDEEKLRQQIGNLLDTRPDGADEILELAKRYLDGWRPGEFDD